MLDRIAGLIHSDRPDELRSGFRWLYRFVRPQLRAIGGLIALSLTGSCCSPG